LSPNVTLFRIVPTSMWAYASRPEDFEAEL
jgi:hypothetical protein